METETDVDLGVTGLLDNDTVPNANQSLYCFSCETPMQGLYCGACGQKNDNYRRSLRSLGVELFSSLTAIEGRIWRTWGALLFKPGKVAREYSDGRRTHWSSPVRVFLAMSLILFSYIALTKTQIISADVNIRPKPGVEKLAADLTPPDLIVSGALHMFETQKQINTRNSNRNFELIDLLLEKVNEVDYDIDLANGGITFTDPTTDNPESDNELKEALRAFKDGIEAGKDVGEKAKASAQEKAKAKDKPLLEVDNRRITAEEGLRDFKNFIRNPSRFNNEISKNLPRVMFLMMPFAMLIGAIFIRGRGNALLYDHLVHTAYIHSVLFFLLLAGLIIGRIPWLSGGFITLIILTYLVIYLPMSLKHMFTRSWRKTIWTSYGVAGIYCFFMFFIMFFLVARGVAAQFGT